MRSAGILLLTFVLLALGLALNLLLSQSAPAAAEWWLTYLCLGALGFLNTWDMPFYLFADPAVKLVVNVG